MRAGAGRPRGTKKEEKERITLPKDLVIWFKHESQAVSLVRKIMQQHRAT